MNDEVYDDIALERVAKEHFGVGVDIQQVILRQVDVSRSSTATVFLTKKKQLMVYIAGQSRLSLGDVEKIVGRMGLRAEHYCSPVGRPGYFDEIGRARFRDVFPSRRDVSSSDIIFYRTLAPYNPALVIISEVKKGEIYRYDSDSRTRWRVGAKFSYRRIMTS